MNKKGILLAEETLKIIVAVICIGFLIYVLMNIYYTNEDTKKISEAKSVLYESDESIRTYIQKVEIENGTLEEGMAEEFIINNPDGWYLFNFTKDKKPNQCAGENCVCICDDVLWDIGGDRQISKCEDKGVCLIKENINVPYSIEITSNTHIIIRKKGNQISITSEEIK